MRQHVGTMQFRTRRKPTDFDVILLNDDSEQNARVVDVNAQGVRVRADASAYQVEDEVYLQLRGKKYATRVAWAEGKEIGLHFDHALPEDIQTLMARDLTQKPKRKRFLLR